MKTPGSPRRSRRHLLQLVTSNCYSIPGSCFFQQMKHNLTPIRWNWIASARQKNKKKIKTLHRFETFCFLNFLFLRSCYATEANHLWQEGRLSLNPDRGGKQSEGHLFSPRAVFHIKPPHGQIQILSSHCKITFQRRTCLTKTIVYFKTALGPLFWPKGWFCFGQKPLAMLPNELT